MGPGGGFTAQEFKFGEFTLDPSRYRLQRGNRTLSVEKLPMELLMLLLEKHGELVSREEIAGRLWGKDVFLDVEHGINTAIRKIRRTLHDDRDKPRFIETVFGKGYRFAAPVVCNAAGTDVIRHEIPATVPLGNETKQLPPPARTLALQRLLLLGGVALLVVTTVALFSYRSLRRPAAAKAQAIRSLAVLPMKNLSGDPGQEYLADGMTEALIGRLSEIGSLRVISRTSTMQLKNTRQTVPEIAQKLRVDAVVEGSVKRQGNRVRVHAQLIRGATDEQLWSRSWDRDLTDSLLLESELSEAIAREVGISLTAETRGRLEHKATANPAARDAYLRGRYFFDQDNAQGARKCLQYFQQAIALDPDYAAAHVGLASCYDLATYFDLISSREATPKIKSASLKAVELDGNLSEAHAALGDFYFYYEWRFRAAEEEYLRALALNPSALAHENYSTYLLYMGESDKALQEIHKARALDPLSLHLADKVGWTLLYARRYQEAAEQFRSVLEMNPNYRRSWWGLARTYELNHKYKQAIEAACRIPALPNVEPFAKALFERRCSLYRKLYGTSGVEPLDRKWFESARQEIEDGIGRDQDAYSIATLFAASGEHNKALDSLERAYTDRDTSLPQLKVDPRMDPLRSSPRFQALLRRMNFPDR